ncbi:MAG: hypothetical protein QUS14_10160 [Pyrinomonadaceae bacterium]|nr:hypothetical protein [Pyrinomonadaceae bacterium]
MKKALIAFVLLAFASVLAAGQEKPLSQQEYVRMLYRLDKAPAEKADLIDALRRRGIDFVVTDGLRSLTRTKGKNDAELRSALDEAGRRRDNPEALKPPTAAEAAEVLQKARQNTLDAATEMPDFVVKQLIQRSAAYAGTGTFRNLDRLVVGVSYRASGEEEYRVLSLNGVIQENAEAKRSYEQTGGTSSTGEFVTMLTTVFKPESRTEFTPVYTDTIRGRRAMMFDFEVPVELAQQRLGCKTLIDHSTVTGMRGRVWIDREFYRVLRIESDATGIPESFPCPAAKRTIDYDWAEIGDGRYLLPMLSNVTIKVRDGGKTFETRNVIRFREYQKFGTEVKAVGEDEEYIPDEQPEKP